MKIFNFLLLLLTILAGCQHKKSAGDLMLAHLNGRNLVADHTIDEQLKALLPGLKCASLSFGSKYYFALPGDYTESDPNQILVISFRPKKGSGTSSGFSDIENRVVFICPLQIADFVATNSLSDSADISGHLGIILLHEMGHFLSGTAGSFDEGKMIQANTESRLGEQDMGTEPQNMTIAKRLELSVDSIAVNIILKGLKSGSTECFNCLVSIQLAINGAEFMLFGKRLLGQFGSPSSNMIKDQAWSHPNIELRMAFMNYYLNPTPGKKEQIDQYLYEREIAPINRQLTDPRIYQGMEKNLPEIQ